MERVLSHYQKSDNPIKVAFYQFDASNMFGLFYIRLDKYFIGFESNYSLDKLWSMVSQMVWTNNL